jgi:hypothetical protein
VTDSQDFQRRLADPDPSLRAVPSHGPDQS